MAKVIGLAIIGAGLCLLASDNTLAVFGIPVVLIGAGLIDHAEDPV